MTPPRDAAIAAPESKPRRKPSRLEVSFELPHGKETSRGLIPMRFDIDGPRGTYELTLTMKSAPAWGRSLTLEEGSLRAAAYLNSHLMPNGTTRVEARVTQGVKTTMERVVRAQRLELGAVGGARAREPARVRNAAGARRLRWTARPTT